MKKIFAILILCVSSAVFGAGITTESAGTVALGKLKAELSGDFYLYNRYYNGDGDFTEFSGNVARTKLAIPVTVKYGLMQNLEAGADFSYVLSTHTLAAGTKLNGNGIGDVNLFGKMCLMNDASMAVSGKININIPLGKSVFNAELANLSVGSGFLAVGITAAATMKVMEGNDLSVNAGFSLPFGVNTTTIGGITMPSVTVTPAGTLSFGVMDKCKIEKDISLILEVNGYIKADGSAAFAAGGDAASAVILAASPQVVLNKQSAIFVRPAVEYRLSETLSVTGGTSATVYQLNDYSSLPVSIFVTVASVF